MKECNRKASESVLLFHSSAVITIAIVDCVLWVNCLHSIQEMCNCAASFSLATVSCVEPPGDDMQASV